MPADPQGVSPLDWRALVAEALRRRKGERLTQRQHAALAGVSIPTIIAFDRGERSLSLAKAFDILRVVGLVVDEVEGDARDAFVQTAFDRWRDVTAGLPQRAPARFPHGWQRIDYALEGRLKRIDPARFRGVLAKVAVPLVGAPVFAVPEGRAAVLREDEGVVEFWSAPPDEGPRPDPAYGELWRAAPAGRLVLIRGHQEDRQETFPPGRLLDVSLPVWRLAEVLLHAARLARLLGAEDEGAITVRLRALYAGLAGRVLKAWANPLSRLRVDDAAARSDEVMLDAAIPLADIDRDLAAHVHSLVAPLYECFGVTGLRLDRVREEIDRLRGNRGE